MTTTTPGVPPSGFGAIPPPLRILVLGHSATRWVSFMGGPRTDVAFPRVLENALLASGRSASVRCAGLTAGLPRHGLQAWDEIGPNWSPDVVVLMYGNMEPLHLLMPRWLQLFAISTAYRRSSLLGRLRRRFVPRIWRKLAEVQQYIDARTPLWVFRRRADGFGQDLTALVKNIRLVGSPLVLALDLHRLAPLYDTWFPGSPGRAEMMTTVLHEVIARADNPDVRLVPVNDALLTVGAPAEYAADGAHFSPAAHRVVGERLAAIVAEWSDRSERLSS